MEAASNPTVLRLSRHVSAESPRLANQVSLPQVSWTEKFLSGLGQWWSSQGKTSEVKPYRSLVVSASGTNIAVVDGYRITFLSKKNGFEEAVGSSASPLEAGFYMCGVWLEQLSVFVAITSVKCIIAMDVTGKELTRTSRDWGKVKDQMLGMFARQVQNGGGERYILTILASDCTIYQTEYGPEGFCERNMEAIEHAVMRKMHPQGIICFDFNGEKSILALVGSLGGIKFTRSTGNYVLSVWRIQDCWRFVELHGVVNDLERGDPLVSPKLFLSPACDFLGLLESGDRLQLVSIERAANGTFQKIQLRDNDIRSSGSFAEISQQSGSEILPIKFSYFEVASERDADAQSPLKSLNGFTEACWWSENALVLVRGASVIIASVPHMQLISQLSIGLSCEKLSITHGLKRCLFVLENIPEDPTQPGVGPSCTGGWRVITLEEYTVTELFQKLLEDADFGFALSFAERYGLDKERVYKCQWLHSDWGWQAVQNILPKIEDRLWALEECTKKISPSMEAMSQLLRHGLDLIDLCLGPGNLKDAAQDAAIRHLCVRRLRLLQYGDRLETYLGLSMDRYNLKDYKTFRSSSLLDVAMKLAECGKTGALSLLYKRHVYSLAPCILQILDAIPETIAPHSYAQLLPSLNSSNPCIIGLERDWVEEEWMKDIIDKYDRCDEEALLSVPLHHSTEHIVKACFGFSWPSESELTEWYIRRARVIDRVSGQLENALLFLDLGKQKGLLNLEELWEDLSTLHWVTYESGKTDDDMDMMNLSLDDWEQLTDYEKFEAMLKGINELNVLGRLKDKALPFMNRKASDTQVLEDSFLVKWMKQIAGKDQLKICDVVLMEAVKGSTILFKSDVECINTGLDCIYACTKLDQWDLMETILTRLSLVASRLLLDSQAGKSANPKFTGKVSFTLYKSTERGYKRESGVGTLGENHSEIVAALDRKIQQAMNHVEAGRLLSYYQVGKPIKFLENAYDDERAVKQLILLMLSKFGRRQPPRSDAEWTSMWDNLQKLQARAFTFLNRQFLFIEYYSSLLKYGKFTLAKSQMRAVGNSLLSPDKAEAVIIQAARDYFFSASSLDSPEIEKARSCLSLVPESKSIAAELDYIDTVTRKLTAFGISMLPMQVKQVRDPMDIVKRALLNSSAEGNLKVDEVLDLARSLGLNSDDQIAAVEEAIAREAAASGHITLALDLCLSLTKRGYGAVWDLCAALARGPEVEGINFEARKELLGFAVSNCDDASIGQLLHTWKEIDFSKRCHDIRKVVDDVNVAGTSHAKDSNEEGFTQGVGECNLLQQDKILLPEDWRQLLQKVTHLHARESFVDGHSVSKEQKSILQNLCLHLPGLLQAMEMDAGMCCRGQEDVNGLISKTVSTILLGLAHCNLLARDELICLLARLAMLKLPRKEESLISVGYLLNLADPRKAVDLFDQEMQHQESLEELHRILNVALKFGLMQGDRAGPQDSPKQRRQRLLKALRQSQHSRVSGTVQDNSLESGNVFWKEWLSKVLEKLDRVDHALELNPVIPEFKMDKLNTGDHDYVKKVMRLLVDSATKPKSSEPEQVSRVYRYQTPEQARLTLRSETTETKVCSLDLHMLEDHFKIFEKYLKQLDVQCKFLSIQTLIAVTANVVLEDKWDCSEGDWKVRLRSLLHFWATVFDEFLEDVEPTDDISRQTWESISHLKIFCKVFGDHMLDVSLECGQCEEMIAQIAHFPSCKGGEMAWFLEAMVSSGCQYQMIVLVWHDVAKDSTNKIDFDNSTILSEISNIYTKVISSSIKTLADLCKSVLPNDCYSQLEPAIKAVSSLSRSIVVDDDTRRGVSLLQEVRLCVWDAICGFAENVDIPPFVRVCLLKLREAIISGDEEAAAPGSFEEYVKRYQVAWIGWEMTDAMTPPLKHTITAVKSTELVSAIWQDVLIKAEDLVSVEAATVTFHHLVAKVNTPQHASLLIELLEVWGDIFGWEKIESVENTLESLTSLEENEAEWGQADGWDDVWDEPEDLKESNERIKKDAGSVNALHACWKTALEKLSFYGEVNLLLHALDKALPRNGKTVLTAEESAQLVTMLAEENWTLAFKVSLLLPYVDVQTLAIEKFVMQTKDAIHRQNGEGDNDSGRIEQFAMMDDRLLMLVLASGRLSTWADDQKFSTLFGLLCSVLASLVQMSQQTSAPLTRELVLPYFLASLTPTSQYTVACAFVVQYIRAPPAFVTWNGAYAALDKFLKAKALEPSTELDVLSIMPGSLSCISHTVCYLQRNLKETLDSALHFLS